jgi:hypothetical protein
MGLLGPGDRRQGPAVEGSIACLGSCREHLRDDRFRLVKRRLLIVEDVSAEVLGSLVFVELCLVCVASVLSQTQFGLAQVGGRMRGRIVFVGCTAVSVEGQLSFVDALLVAVGTNLLAFSDALVQIDQRLFLVEFVLLAYERVFTGGGQLRSPSVVGRPSATSSCAGRPM